MEGVHRFLARVWRLYITPENELQKNIVKREAVPAELKRLHQTIKKVGDDVEAIKLNTAISALMVFVNETLKDQDHAWEIMEKFLLLLAPFAPHLAEELWQRMSHSASLSHEKWPVYKEEHLVEDEVEMAVLIGGKVRGKIRVANGTPEAAMREAALADEKVKPWTDGKEVVKVIVVPGRTINIVVK